MSTCTTRSPSATPAQKILQTAQTETCDLIVDEHARSDRHAQAVLRFDHRARPARDHRAGAGDAPTDEGPSTVDDIRRLIGRMLVPVDLTPASLHQVQVARGLSEALGVPMIATHVVEPVRSPLAAKLHLPSIELERRARAEDALNELLATVPLQLHPEALVAFGDPPKRSPSSPAIARPG